MSNSNSANCYDFALLISGVSELSSEIENKLFEAGCDDATLSIQYGGARLDFTRSAANLKDAILSAIRDVSKCGLVVLQVDESNLVTQAEIARRVGRSRSLIGQYISGQRGPGGFPPPVCHLGETMPLWRWCEVSYWLSQNDMIRPELLLEAETIAAINNVLDRLHQQSRNPHLMDEVYCSLVASQAQLCG